MTFSKKKKSRGATLPPGISRPAPFFWHTIHGITEVLTVAVKAFCLDRGADGSHDAQAHDTWHMECAHISLMSHVTLLSSLLLG